MASSDGRRTAPDGGKLKRRMIALPPAFVELMAPATSGLPEYTLELERHRSRLRIHCKGATQRISRPEVQRGQSLEVQRGQSLVRITAAQHVK